MVKYLFLILVLSLTACNDSNAPEWFESQGVNLTECGPTVASNAINWAGGSSDRYTTRSLFTSPSWWTLANIYSAISKNGVHVEYHNESNIDIIKKDNISGIMYINRTHFINVDYMNGKWVSFDPLYGISEKTRSDLLQMSWVNFIAVYKK